MLAATAAGGMMRCLVFSAVLAAVLAQSDFERAVNDSGASSGRQFSMDGMPALEAMLRLFRNPFMAALGIRSPRQRAPPFSLSQQVGLDGVSSLILHISDQDRQKALEQTKLVYCGRMDACRLGRQMARDMGTNAAMSSMDKNMPYLDSAMMGIRGMDCENMYRGCMDFQ
ncbi:uncharacterized protein LOC144150975 [Haemaphysalis longicornis]